MLPPDPLPGWIAGAGAMAAAAGIVWALTAAQRRRHMSAQG